MCYAITSGEDYIMINNADGVQMIAKRQIIGVVITGAQKVRIDTKLPGNNYCLDHRTVLQPQTNSVFELADTINDMLKKNVSSKKTKVA